MKSLAECIADDIMSMIIIEGRFHPGEKILNESDFAKELFVSRSTFREAVKILSERGVLIVRHGSGMYVSKDVLENRENRFKRYESKIDARELNEIRMMIEPETAYYAALRASNHELKRIAYYGQLVENKIVAGVTDRRTEEIRFHLSIARAAHNSFMDRLAPTIFDAIDKSRNVFNLEEVRQGTLLDHRMIIQYLNERNADFARTAMRSHMLRGIQALKMER